MKKTANGTKAQTSNNSPKNNNPKEKENKSMDKPKMTPNFIINSGDARLLRGTLRKAKDATPAVAAVAEKKDKDGNITQKAVAAVAAKPAVAQSYKMIIGCNTEEIAKELIARMADQGLAEANNGQVIKDGDQFTTCYVAESDKIIRAAFKKSKSKDGYNAAGLKIITDQKKAEEKAKKEAEAKAKKEEEAKAKKKVEEGAKKAAADSKKKDETKGKTKDATSDEDGWPEA